ncbi:MAG: histidine phosphatase family protein [Bacteroidales bacterium]|nr:histidine phosphatase family protein [Bacteroidales bacterium]
MKKLLILVALIYSTVASAQTTKEYMLAHPETTAGNQMKYSTDFKPQTKAPKGYKPFYISHYGRHGSRYHYTGIDYMMARNMFLKADSANALTPRGKELCSRLCRLYDDGFLRAGDLTQTGFKQHQGIAKRMVESFPELFGKNAFVDVKSSTSHRVIASMDAFCQQLKSMRPDLQIRTETSRRVMTFINLNEKDSVSPLLKSAEYRAADKQVAQTYDHTDRFINSIFSDAEYVKKYVNAPLVMHKIAELNSNMQGIDDLDFTLDDFFTTEEKFEMWQNANLYWYNYFGPSPYTNARGVKMGRNLLANVIDEANKAIAGNGTTATLRFGHDTGLCPLACLMQLEGCTAQVKDLTEVYKYWCDFKIIPMGSNMQIVFYRSKKSPDILIKIMLNENEVKLPIASVSSDAPYYYKWRDVEKFWRDILASIQF